MLQGQITTGRVRQALQASGYEDDFLKATYVGLTESGLEHHKIFFMNDGVLDTGSVFVWQSLDGRLLGDY